MSTAVPSRNAEPADRRPSQTQRRLRKAGRALFYGLIITCPFMAGSRPTWALGLFATAWLVWFLIFLVPQYARNGIGGRPWPSLGLLAIAGWCCLQGFWPHRPYTGAAWPDESFLSANPWTTLEQGLTFLVGAVVFAGAAWMVDSSERIRALLLCLAISGGVLCIVAFTLATDDGNFLTSYQAWLPEFQASATRIRATYSNPDRFAALLLMYIPCIVGLWVSLHFTSWRRDGPPSFHAISRDFPLLFKYTLYWIGITILMATLFLTGCRAAAITGSLSALAVLVLYGRKLLTRQRGYIPFLVVILLLILQQILFGFENVSSRLGTLGTDWDTRAVGWGFAGQLVRNRPLMGWGAGCFGDVAPSLPNYQQALVWNHAHNQYLEYASGLGLPVTLLLLGCLVWWGHEVLSAMRHLRSRRRIYVICICWATINVMLVGLFDVPLYEPASLWVLLTLMGAAWGIATRPNEPLSPDEPPPSLLSWQEAHVAESAPHRQLKVPAPRLTVLLLALTAMAGLVLSVLILNSGWHQVRIQKMRNKPVDLQDPRWQTMLENAPGQRWDPRPAQLLAQIGLQRHLKNPISPADQLFDPPLFNADLPPDRLESPYAIRRNLQEAIRIEPLNSELYFYLALLDYLQRQPPATQAEQILDTLHPELIRQVLLELHPAASEAEKAQWNGLNAQALSALARNASAADLTQAMIRVQVVLPADLADWRLQTMQHLGTASGHSKGFARMQLFCGLLRLHLWNSQETGEQELQRGMQELKNAFESNATLLGNTMPLLSFLGLSTDQIDQVVPDNANQHWIAMQVYRSWGLYVEALRHLDQVADRVDRDLLRGDLYMRLGNTDQGIQCFQSYLDQPPPEGLIQRATEIETRWGTAVPEKAVLFWKTQQTRFPDQKKWTLFLAHAFDRLGDQRSAQECYTQALPDYDSDALRMRLAVLTTAPALQIEHLKRAVDLAPNNLSARASLILKLRDAGDLSYIQQRDILQSKIRDREAEDEDSDFLSPEIQRAIDLP